MKRIKYYVLLQLIVIIYALGSIPSKLASNEPFMSFKYIFFMGLLFLSLAIFAITWQQILKKVPLSIAYVNKATSIIWGMLISYLIFDERVTATNIIGTAIVLVGILIMVKGEYNNE